ncbi:hypothetical protein CIB95_00480 [Lottiidibacillus patelloidae]|uniref:Uncharacterized protein n=1 Tax=Lottiidibacillus patelloidae TaxID=2670334 RepID=A0A263BWP8_9BACI|nr:hypothetical protein [Lottiidibacillus patelloidae]OZM58090.1 hypothetical protein CIB95_00480 [Lottiidibacillus patelloidae]
MMKKTMALIPTLIIALVYIFLFHNGDSVEYEVLTREDYPKEIQEKLEQKIRNDKEIIVIHDKKNTYIYFSPDHTTNEYITTSLDVKKNKNKYVVTAKVSYATNDTNVNDEILIKLHKISEDDISIKEIDNK